MAEHPGDDPRHDPVTLQALLHEGEEAKRTLSERSRTQVVYSHRGQRVALGLSRAEFEEMTADLLERTRVTTKLVLNEAGLDWSEVDKLLLSGGSTRMPQVARMLRDLSGQEPDRSMSPDEAVAHGARALPRHSSGRAQRYGRGRQPEYEGGERQRAQLESGHADSGARAAL